MSDESGSRVLRRIADGIEHWVGAVRAGEHLPDCPACHPRHVSEIQRDQLKVVEKQ